MAQKYQGGWYGRVIATGLHRTDHPLTEPTGVDRSALGLYGMSRGQVELHGESMDRPVEASLKATYRALLARGLEAGEAANLTAFLHGLPSAGFHWTLPEIEAIVHRRLAHAADLRSAAIAALQLPADARRSRQSPRPRRASRSGSTT